MYVISGNFDLEVWEAGCYCIFPPMTIYLQLHFMFELANRITENATYYCGYDFVTHSFKLLCQFKATSIFLPMKKARTG